MCAVRKWTAILLALCFAVLGSGLAEHLHAAHHAAEDARVRLAALAAGQPAPDEPPIHNDSNCAFHLQLHLPALPVLIAPPMALIGLLIGLVVVTLPTLAPRTGLVRLDCRGPPAHRMH
jgi:hypothetical protein